MFLGNGRQNASPTKVNAVALGVFSTILLKIKEYGIMSAWLIFV